MVGVFGAVLLGAVGAGPAIGSGGHAIPDVQKLFRSAVAQVRAADHGVFAKAVVFEADGSTRGGGLVTARPGSLSWRFVLDNPDAELPVRVRDDPGTDPRRRASGPSPATTCRIWRTSRSRRAPVSRWRVL